jgi:activator of HSP90 ATPase
MAQLTAT